MSRIGKNPVTIPAGVEVTLNGRDLTVKGSKGTLQFAVPADINTNIEGKEVAFTPRNDAKTTRALWGTTRARVANMVNGVSKGFTRKLQIQGVGYRAAVAGTSLDLQLGFSHPVKMAIPQGLTVQVNDNTEIVITGADKHKIGQFAADVRGVRPPEPYKGKGVRYSDEQVRRKEGKKK
ncbi:MAG: 50S ribosomal protein L6 [Proteobacteria bacterium]|nr:50S ribosomal protein L6 [Pseudomonadota bacterium]